MTDLNAYLAQKRTALDSRRERIGRGEVGPVALKAEARIEGRSGVRRIRVREHAVISDSLPDFAGYDLGPGSPELQLGVLGSCLAHSFLIQAAAQGLPLDSLSVEVTATFDPRANEAGYEDVPVHPQDLAYTIRIASPRARPRSRRCTIASTGPVRSSICCAARRPSAAGSSASPPDRPSSEIRRRGPVRPEETTMSETEPHPSARDALSRRRLLRAGLSAAAALPLGFTATTGRAWGPGPGTPFDPGPLCAPAAATEAAAGPLRPIKLAWNATAICTAAAPVAKERGIFARHGLDVEFVNFGGSTEALLEAIATGKADAGIGMALRWLKPMEQGFDVKITAGLHGGCLRLLAAKSANISDIASLKGKTIAISDQASPAKNFFGLLLANAGIDPEREVEWRQYPADLLNLAVEKGEAHALADADPRTWIWLKDPRLTEVATNLTGIYATRSCCVVAVRGSLVRNDRAVAGALTRAVLEGGHRVQTDPADAAAIFANYGGKGSVEDLAAMLRSQTHQHRPVGADLKQEIALYGDELKRVNVLRRTTDTAKFAERVYADVLS